MTDPTPTRDEAVPTGWKLVPIEPTPEMMASGERAWMNRDLSRPDSNPISDCYRAMLASAPAPASGGVDAAFTVASNLLRDGCTYEDRKVAADFIRSALSPAATPVSEAEPVAWMDDGSTRAGTGTEFRVVTAHTKAGMPKAAAEAYTTPLYLAKPAASPASPSVVLDLYREAVRVDVKMEGPQFMGCNTSALKRAWEADRASLASDATPAPTSGSEDGGEAVPLEKYRTAVLSRERTILEMHDKSEAVIAGLNKQLTEQFDLTTKLAARLDAALAKPASEPAGGDVREALEVAFDFLGGVDGASEVRDKLLAALQSTSAGRVGE